MGLGEWESKYDLRGQGQVGVWKMDTLKIKGI